MLPSSKTSKQSELSISLPKCAVSASFFNFFVWSKVMVLKLRVEETKMSLRHNLNGHHLDTFKARLQGAERVTFSKQHASTRTTESGSEGVPLGKRHTSTRTTESDRSSLAASAH